MNSISTLPVSAYIPTPYYLPSNLNKGEIATKVNEISKIIGNLETRLAEEAKLHEAKKEDNKAALPDFMKFNKLSDEIEQLVKNSQSIKDDLKKLQEAKVSCENLRQQESSETEDTSSDEEIHTK